jgi:hypothetical protein
VSVLVVVQAVPAQLATWLARNPQPFPVVSDPGRTAYQSFGLGRVGWLHFFRPAVLWGYLRLLSRGGRVRKPYPGEDLLQLGGDFLLDHRRRVVFAHPSRSATDRPTMDDVLVAVGSPCGGRGEAETGEKPADGRP